MILAVTHENGRVSARFDRTAECKLYQIEEGKVLTSRVLPISEGGQAGVVLCLIKNRVGALLCGAIDAPARELLGDLRIPVFSDVCGECDACVSQFLSGELASRQPAACDPSQCAACGRGCGSASDDEQTEE